MSKVKIGSKVVMISQLWNPGFTYLKTYKVVATPKSKLHNQTSIGFKEINEDLWLRENECIVIDDDGERRRITFVHPINYAAKFEVVKEV